MLLSLQNAFRTGFAVGLAMLISLAAWHGVEAAEPRIPVSAAPTLVRDVPIYLRGLGTVQAFNTVEIKAEVNGTLVAVPVGEGQEVRVGQIVAEIDPRPYKAALDQATAQRAEDEAQLHSAALDLARYQTLETHSFASVQQVDDQQATVNRLLAAVQADDAAIEAARINLGFCTIRAPITGRVGFYQTDVGNLIEASAQTPIISITQDKPISVIFTLPEAQLPAIEEAVAKAPLTVLAYSGDDGTNPSPGVLETPNNAIDTETGTIALKATFANNDDRLWPGEFVNARLLIETLRHVVSVPLPAILHGPAGLFVYRIGADEKVEEQAVEVGYQDEAVAVVTKGLRGGEDVVVEGASRLVPGASVSMTLVRAAAGQDVAP
jgi:membrane fusion protein, multidrug efflux system